VFLDVKGKLIHLFNADARSVELYLLNWQNSNLSKSFVVDLYSREKTENLDDDTKRCVIALFEDASLSSNLSRSKSKITRVINAAAKRFTQEEKLRIKVGSSHEYLRRFMRYNPDATVTLPVNIEDSKPLSRKIEGASSCRIVRSEQVGYTLEIPQNHPILEKKSVTQTSIPFRTRQGALSAMIAIDESTSNESAFCLYLSRRETLDNYVNASQVTSRQMFKLVANHEGLMDAFMDDWGGTVVGYSIHKSIRPNLGVDIGQSVEGTELLLQVVANSESFLNTQNSSIMNYF
jgi:hypothetical protein